MHSKEFGADIMGKCVRLSSVYGNKETTVIWGPLMRSVAEIYSPNGHGHLFCPNELFNT